MRIAESSSEKDESASIQRVPSGAAGPDACSSHEFGELNVDFLICIGKALDRLLLALCHTEMTSSVRACLSLLADLAHSPDSREGTINWVLHCRSAFPRLRVCGERESRSAPSPTKPKRLFCILRRL